MTVRIKMERLPFEFFKGFKVSKPSLLHKNHEFYNNLIHVAIEITVDIIVV